MKNRFIITVSDIHGVKQYTLHQIIKVFVLWVVLAVVVMFAIGALVVNSLSDEVEDMNALTQRLIETKKELENKNKTLQVDISRKSETLESMNDHLKEIEKIVGLEPDIESAFGDRANSAKDKIVQRVQKTRVTVAQLSILNKSVPNGVPLKKYKKITDKFGYRIHPIMKKRQFHAGIDLSAAMNTPIYATADGVVEYANEKGSYGNYLLINHPFGFKTAFGHLSRFAVKKGDYISKGDIVGYVGNTGRSTGPHLHYEIRYLNKWLDPQRFLNWSSSTYIDVMTSERAVNWVGLMQQIESRLQIQALNNTNNIRISYGAF